MDAFVAAAGDAETAAWDAIERLAASLVTIDASGDVEKSRAALGWLADHPRVVTRLDELARRVLWYSARYSPAIDQVAERLGAGTPGPVAVALASTHPDGRVRERAVQHMLAQPSPVLMPFLVLRTGDWVRQVRDRARAGLALLLHESPRMYLLAAVDMTVLMEGRLRGSFAGVQVLAAALQMPRDVWDQLAPGVNRAARRFAFDAALLAGQLPVDELMVIAETDPDLPVRARAAEAAVREAVWTTRIRHLRRLSGSRHREVRVLALTGLVRAGQPAEVVAFLDDSAALVRAVARDAAHRIGIDALAHYRTQVAADQPALGVIDGLAETGNNADSERLLELLAHPTATVRAHAVRGLRGLGVTPAEQIIPLLRDRSDGVIREATVALRPTARAIPVDLLWGLLADTDRPAIRRAGYRLLQQHNRTIQTRAALLLAVDPHPQLAARAIADLTRIARDPHRHPWKQRAARSMNLDPDQIADLRRLTERAAHTLGEHTMRQLLDQLDHPTPAGDRPRT